MAVEVDRERFLAYRVAAQGLDRAAGGGLPALLDIGVQDTPYGSARLALTYDCVPCGARHVSGGLLQQVGLAGGVRLLTEGRGTRLTPIEDRPPVPARAEGTEDLIRASLRLLGPATLADVAAYLGARQTAVRQAWPGDLAEVRIEDRTAWLPADRLDLLHSAPPPRLVRLLPPSDAYLLTRDRALLVPDEARRAEVWKAPGTPGALLVDGEIAGVWRARKASRLKTEVTVNSFGPVSAGTRAAVEGEALRVAAARETAEVSVRFTG